MFAVFYTFRADDSFFFLGSFSDTSLELLLILPILADIDRQDILYVILEQFSSFKRIEVMLTVRFR